jgi:hypothetical protein
MRKEIEILVLQHFESEKKRNKNLTDAGIEPATLGLRVTRPTHCAKQACEFCNLRRYTKATDEIRN